MIKPNQAVDPNRMTLEQLAKVLSSASQAKIPVEQLAADVECGAPTNPDGTINLVHYAAWLARENERGN